MTSTNPKIAKKIIDKDLEVKRIDFYMQELKEVEVAGDAVLQELTSVEKLMRQIISWRPYSHVDVRRRRGYRLEPNRSERRFLESKLKDLPQLDIALTNFITELKDVSKRHQLPIEKLLRRVENFLVKLYRGLMTDLSFQMETQNVLMEISVFKRNVLKLKEAMLSEWEKALKDREKKKDAYEEMMVGLEN